MGFLGGSSGSIGSVGGATARLLVLITGNSSQLTSELSKASAGLQGFQGNASTAGTALTRGITVPLLAIGTVSVASAVEFQAAMSKLAALTPLMDQQGVSMGTVTTALMEMSKVTATSATDLAGTLYFAGSAGLNFADSMQVTEMAAKGAAMGMGNAEDIARTLVAAMNAYGPGALTAAQAMDALTVAIQEGLAEPAEFAIALGRLLPVAEEAGISFDQLVMSVSALTNIGVPTRVATTGLRALFQQLNSPLEGKATEELAKYSITAEDLAKTLDAGPISALQFLDKEFIQQGGNLRSLIPQIRGYSSILGLMGKSAGHYKEMQDKANNSFGAFQKAWDKMKDTPAIKFKQTLADLNRAGINLGNALLPVFIAIMEAVNGLANAFSGMSPSMQKAAAAMMVLGAAAGPFLKLVGSVTAGGAGMFSNFSSWTSGLLVMAAAALVATNALGNLASGQMSMGVILQASIGGVIAVGLALKSMVSVASTAAAGYVAAQVAVASANELVAITTTQALSAQGAYGAIVKAGNAATAEGVAASLAMSEARAAQAAATTAAAQAEAKLAGARGGGKVTGLLAGLSGGAIFGIAAGITAVAVGVTYLMGASARAKAHVDEFRTSLTGAATSSQTMNQYIAELAKTHEDYAATLRSVAAAQNLGNVSVGVGLQELPTGLMNQYSTWLDTVQNATPDQQGEGYDTWIADLEAVERAMVSSTETGKGLGEALKLEGIEGGIDEAKDLLGGGFSEQADEMLQLVDTYAVVSQARAQYIQDGKNQILANDLENKAVENLAARYGVSTESIRESLASQGLSAVQAAADMGNGFGIAAGYINEYGKAVGDLVKQQEAWTASAENVRTTVGLFGELPEKVKEGTAELAKQAKQHANYTTTTLRDMEKLNRAGMSSAQINEILAQSGPQMIQALAKSTPGQLKKIITSYDKTLTAVDALILKEADHQKVKGEKMTQNLKDGIESNPELIGTGKKLLADIAKGLKSGKINNKDIAIAQSLAEDIRKDTNIPVQAADKMVAAIYRDLAAGKNFGNAGKSAILKYKAGLLSAQGATTSAAVTISRGIEAAFKGLNLSSTGQMVTQSLASGITAAAGFVTAAVDSVIADAKAKADASLKNSPEYFTYYMGKKLMEDMGRGIQEGGRKVDRIARPPITAVGAGFNSAGRKGRGGGQRFKGSISITNWDEGVGMIDGRIMGHTDVQDRHNDRLERMND